MSGFSKDLFDGSEANQELCKERGELYRQYHMFSDIKCDVDAKFSLAWVSRNTEILENCESDMLETEISLSADAEWACCFEAEEQSKTQNENLTRKNKSRKSRVKKNLSPSELCSSHALEEDDLTLIRNLKKAFGEDHQTDGLVDRITHWLKAFDTSLKFDNP